MVANVPVIRYEWEYNRSTDDMSDVSSVSPGKRNFNLSKLEGFKKDMSFSPEQQKSIDIVIDGIKTAIKCWKDHGSKFTNNGRDRVFSTVERTIGN